MTQTRGPGRPAMSSYCIDCHREGLRPPEAKPKAHGTSYCVTHLGRRQRKSRKTRQSAVTTRREVVVGYWSKIPDSAREGLQVKFTQQMRAMYRQYEDPRKAAPYAFEWACMELALIKEHRLSIFEEDQVIEEFHGSRNGKSAWEPGRIRPYGPDGLRDEPEPIEGPVLLPDPYVRPRFRANMFGGPTTVGEQEFGDYYRQVFRKEPPEEFLDVEEVPEQVEAIDGVMVPPGILKDYNDGRHGAMLRGEIEHPRPCPMCDRDDGLAGVPARR